MNKSADMKPDASAQDAATREELCRDLTKLIQTKSEAMTRLGYTPEMARFDCLATVKIIVDELYDDFNVGHARKEWYREMLRAGAGVR